MHSRTRQYNFWYSLVVSCSIGGLLGLGGYVAARLVVLQSAALTAPAQAAESSKGHAHHDHQAHEADLAPFMIRNAYHFATLYHAARAARWELAAYQAEELEENLTKAMAEAGPYAPFLKDFLKDYIAPLQQTITAQHMEQFRTAFQATVGGCNDCHKATKHAFIVIPSEPPLLSIFVLPPVGQ